MALESLKKVIWTSISKTLFLCWSAILLVVVTLYLVSVGFIRSKSLDDSLDVASRTVSQAMSAGDWNMSQRHLEALASANNFNQLKLVSPDSLEILMGPIGEKSMWAYGSICRTHTGSEFVLSGCIQVVRVSELFQALLFSFLSSIFAALMYWTFRRKILDLVTGISNELDSINHLNLDSTEIIKSYMSLPTISEIKSVRSKIIDLLKQIQETSKKEALHKLSLQVAHDISSPVSALKIIASTMHELTSDHRAVLESATSRIEGIASSLLKKENENRLQSEVEIEFDLSKALQEVIDEKRITTRDKQINFKLTVLESISTLSVLAPRNKFLSVISNLLNNAVESIALSGQVSISLGETETHFKLDISDTGSGISPDLLRDLGKRSISSKMKGHGLGLTDAFQSVQKWGGEINISSQLQRGTNIQILLPHYKPGSQKSHSYLVSHLTLMLIPIIFMSLTSLHAMDLFQLKTCMNGFSNLIFRKNSKLEKEMKMPYEGSLVDGELAFRSNSQNLSGRKLIFAIPGGAGIAGDYMDKFISDIASSQSNAVGLVIDLPNHGKSARVLNGPINHLRAMELIVRGFAEISEKFEETVIVGHSLGARLALELFTRESSRISKAFLISVPIAFNTSERFERRKAELGIGSGGDIDSEEKFQKFWRDLLPLYFAKPPNPQQVSRLSKDTYWIGNQSFEEGHPTFEYLSKQAYSNSSSIYFIEGEGELMSPPNQADQLRSSFPAADVYSVKESAHFPMLENPESLKKYILSKL